MTQASQRIGDYELREPLGRGATATVFRAWDPQLQREVALKLFPVTVETSRSTRRFDREAEALARLRHPHVVRVHTVGEDQGRRYLVMDLVSGRSLAEVLERDGPLAPERAVELTLQVASALQAAHDQEILHRDLKPENVLLRDDDGAALLTDFGLAKDLAAPRTSLSQSGQFLGTPGYWPPEQARGDMQAVGPRSDVYALGATLYALLTGGPPFETTSLVQALTAALEEIPTPPTQLDPRIPTWLSDVCLRCLQKDPAQRYPSASAVAEALARRQRRVPGGPLWAVLPLILVGAAGAAWSQRDGGPPPPAASPSAPATPPPPAPPDPQQLARQRFYDHLLATELEQAEDSLQALRGTADRAALSAALEVERQRLALRPQTELDESALLTMSRLDRLEILRETQALLAEALRLDATALEPIRERLLGSVMTTAAQLLFLAWDGGFQRARPIDEDLVQALRARAPATEGAVLLGLALALRGGEERAAWAATQALAPRAPLALDHELLRAHLLVREWYPDRVEACVRLGEAALSRITSEPTGVRLVRVVRPLRQDVAQAHLQVGLGLLRAREPALARPHLERAYRLGYESFSTDPLDAPPLDQADASLPRYEAGLAGVDHGALNNLVLTLLVAGQLDAAERLLSARESPLKEVVLRAEIAFTREGPEAALALLSDPSLDVIEETWGIRAHAHRVLGHSDLADQAFAPLLRRGNRKEVGIPWRMRGEWCRQLAAGEDVWWPGARD